MRGQSQVIVGGDVDHVLTVKGALGRLLIVQNAQTEMRALGFEFVHLICEVGKLRARTSDWGHFEILPALTFQQLATSNWQLAKNGGAHDSLKEHRTACR